MNSTFTHPQYQQLFKEHELDSFYALWDVKVDWFEAPNERRGGWSGVGQLRLTSSTGEEVLLYVKKQQNHGRFSFRHPIKGEPTFRREFKNLQFLKKHAFAAPEVVYFAQDDSLHQRAILITLALDQYQSLDEWFQPGYSQLSEAEKTVFLQALGQNIRHFHSLGMVHRALYPKHVFINTKTPDKIAVIDLEKARLTAMGWHRTYLDVAALFRHAPWLSKDEQLIFFRAYCRESQLSYRNRWFYKVILQRANR